MLKAFRGVSDFLTTVLTTRHPLSPLTQTVITVGVSADFEPFYMVLAARQNNVRDSMLG